MKYKEFDILKKAKFSTIASDKELYIIYVECDACDADYMKDTLKVSKSDFEEDELFLLVLSYISKSSGKFTEKWYASYGQNVQDNMDFPWLGNYLSREGILIYIGMDDTLCHSINSINIVYYDENGKPNKVELPDIDNLFEDKKEFIDYLNKLYEPYEESNKEACAIF